MDIYVFGLGNVGLPMACWIALSGSRVFGIDINNQVIENIKNGQLNIEEYYHGIHINSIARKLFNEKILNISSSFTRVSKEPSVFLVSVGIADRADGSKDLSPILSVIDELCGVLVPNDLIILRSTMIPGTCENIIAPKLKSLNIPFLLAYCPETLIETRAFDELENNPVILSGIDEKSYIAAEAFLRSVSGNTVYRASNIRTAEMAKVVQNIHRDVNIAFANEMSDAASLLHIDAEELKMLVNVNPRVNMLSSGPGVGGYCLPNALSYLNASVNTDKACSLKLSKTARELNNKRPAEIANFAIDVLKSAGKQAESSVIAVIGLAMKNYCSDLRLTPAIEIIRALESNGAAVKAYDPLIPKQFPFQAASFNGCIEGSDCLIIAANQKGLCYNGPDIVSLMSPPAVIIDTQHSVKHIEGVKIYKI